MGGIEKFRFFVFGLYPSGFVYISWSDSGGGNKLSPYRKKR